MRVDGGRKRKKKEVERKKNISSLKPHDSPGEKEKEGKTQGMTDQKKHVRSRLSMRETSRNAKEKKRTKRKRGWRCCEKPKWQRRNLGVIIKKQTRKRGNWGLQKVRRS